MASVSETEAVHIEPVSLEAVRSLTAPQPGPCLSLYQPTHRNVPGNTVDRPVFRHLVEALEEALVPGYPRDEIDALLRPFRLLAADHHFWEHTREGLAVLAADGRARVFHLPSAAAPLAVAGERFHTLPLVRLAASLERFNVLALTSRQALVYEGLYAGPGSAPRRLEPVPLGVEPTPEANLLARDEVVSAELLQPHRVKHGTGPTGRGESRYVHGGFGSKQDDIDADTEIFFRAVDEAVHERVTRHTDLPLVLVALPHLAAVFRGLSKNRLFLEDFAPCDPHLLSADELAARVMPIFDAARSRRIDRVVRLFDQSRDRGLAGGDLADVARAAVAGRVATLLIEADRFETGSFDRATGGIRRDAAPPHDLSRTGDEPAVQREDVFGAVAEEVLLHGGGIVSLDRGTMPTDTGVAAVYRY